MEWEMDNGKSILEVGNVAMIISLNDQGRIAQWNTCAMHKFGFESAEVMGKPLANFLASNNKSTSAQELDHMLQVSMGVDHSETKEFTGLKKNGSRFPLELELRTQHTNSGLVYTVVMIDISRRRALEVDLINKAKALDLLSFQCSHDLKAPYCSAQGLLQLLRQKDLSLDASDLVDLLESSLNSGKQLLEDLAMISIIAKAYRNIEPIDVDRMLHSTVSKLQMTDYFEKVDLDVELQLEATLYSNEQLLGSLLKNMVRYVQMYSCSDDDQENDLMKLSIKTNSKESIITLAFNGAISNPKDPFCTDGLQEYTSANESTPGLCVYLIRNIASLLDGKLQFEMNQDQSSYLSVTIPNPKPSKYFEKC
ncbi:PAS domain S-box protein [Gilvibacter sp.]|uniref:PAS domain S-box protein n=1 Tax=Gilvibacter sp. TaxID=2729997 RepID=UPI0035BE50CD